MANQAKCPDCGTKVEIYSGNVLERHKIYYNSKGKQVYNRTTKYKWCDRKQI